MLQPIFVAPASSLNPLFGQYQILCQIRGFSYNDMLKLIFIAPAYWRHPIWVRMRFCAKYWDFDSIACCNIFLCPLQVDHTKLGLK